MSLSIMIPSITIQHASLSITTLRIQASITSESVQSVAITSIQLTVVMLAIVMLSVMAPMIEQVYDGCLALNYIMSIFINRLFNEMIKWHFEDSMIKILFVVQDFEFCMWKDLLLRIKQKYYWTFSYKHVTLRLFTA